jgi:hypothetical protein
MLIVFAAPLARLHLRPWPVDRLKPNAIASPIYRAAMYLIGAFGPHNIARLSTPQHRHHSALDTVGGKHNTTLVLSFCGALARSCLPAARQRFSPVLDASFDANSLMCGQHPGLFGWRTDPRTSRCQLQRGCANNKRDDLQPTTAFSTTI